MALALQAKELARKTQEFLDWVKSNKDEKGNLTVTAEEFNNRESDLAKEREKYNEAKRAYDAEVKAQGELEELKRAQIDQPNSGSAARQAHEDVAQAAERMLREKGFLPEQASKSIGKAIVESKGYQENPRNFRGEDADFDVKTLFARNAGWEPESTRSGRVVLSAQRSLNLLDIIPITPVTMAVLKWMLETTATFSAVEVAEGGTYPESAFALTEQNQPVQKIPTSIPITDEQLEDVEQVESYLTQRLTYDLQRRLELQISNGNGTAPNLKGVLQYAIGSQALGTDPIFDAFANAIKYIQINGQTDPSHVVMHPTNYWNIRLTRTADGIYLYGDPSQPGPQTLFGYPIVSAQVISAGTGLVGDFTNHCQLGVKRGITFETGYSGTQFVEGKRTIRADMRAVFALYRLAAFCKVTGLPTS